jgi:TfoX/Sxy family transcriptional regulator of competence genes
MAYDEALADRVRQALGSYEGLVERKMFGGLGFMLGGNMAVGLHGGELMLRLGDEGAAEALKSPHVRVMDFAGRPMKSMVYVAPAAFKTDKALQAWVAQAAQHALSLPPKPAKPRKP